MPDSFEYWIAAVLVALAMLVAGIVVRLKGGVGVLRCWRGISGRISGESHLRNLSEAIP